VSATPWIGLVVALGCGLLVGIERERRKGAGPQREAAGLRTFTLATVAGALAQSVGPGLLVAAGALAIALLAALAYWRTAGAPGSAHDPGLTTEVALVVAYLVGVQCVVQPVLGAACGAVLAALLAARDRMHRFATESLTEDELRDALVLAGVALVVVPLAPAEPLRWLGGLAPRTAAALVLVVLLIQAAAHLARRLAGERHALVFAGALGGFVSSTATIATLGARARTAQPAQRTRLAGAAALSGAATWLQVLAMAAVAAPSLLPRLLPVCAAGALTAAAAGAWSLRRRDGDAELPPAFDARRPLRLREALWVAALLLGVSIVVGALQSRFGAEGLLAGSALAALADAHAPVAASFGLHGSGRIGAAAVMQVLLLALAVNSASRSVLACVAGGRAFGAHVTLALVASVGAAAALAFLLAPPPATLAP
jgi:uncharacterized membrane protein (DUF4010 family)